MKHISLSQRERLIDVSLFQGQRLYKKVDRLKLMGESQRLKLQKIR